MKTLADLQTEIKNWSERNDISNDQINNFIYLTEMEFKDDFFLPPNERISLLTTDANSDITIPSDYLKAKHLRVSDAEGRDLPIYRKPNEFVVRSGSHFLDPGTPRYFERHGGKFIFSPRPGEGTQIELTYYSLIPSMIDIAEADPNGTNFVMNVMPSVYLFGGLMFLNQFIMNEERANFFGKFFERAKQDLIDMQMEAEMSGSSLHVVGTMTDSGSTW